MATGIPEDKIHVMLNGVAPLPRPTRKSVRPFGRIRLFRRDFVAGILARVEEYKGHGLLLQAAAALAGKAAPLKSW